MSPNFFIVGGAKCGTTNISYYLNSHPKIFFSELNEPYYFCKWDVPKDYSRNSMITNIKKYLDLFKKMAKSYDKLEISNMLYDEILSLPLYPTIRKSDQNYVINSIKNEIT